MDKSNKINLENKILCPIDGAKNELNFSKEELDPLLEFLTSNKVVEASQVFARGTITKEQKLDCCKQDLGAEGARLLSNALKFNTQIKSILLGTGGIGNEGAKNVGKLLEENKSIETVYLGCNYIGAEGAAALSKSLEDNSSVRALWLKRNPIGVEGAKKVAQLLRKNRNIRSLDLVNTQIGIEGLKGVLEVLEMENYPIERLYLSGNAFDTKVGVLLSNFLSKNTHLKELLLSVNCLGSEGVQQLADGLKLNQQLSNLSLASNGIEEEGIVYLLKIVSEHSSLQALDLGYSRSTKVLGAKANEMGALVAESLGKMLAQNQQLYYLDIARHHFNQWDVDKVIAGLEQNKSLKELHLGKGIHKKQKAYIKELLAQNLANDPQGVLVRHQDVKMIKSVYR